MSTFRIGQRVVCVDATQHQYPFPLRVGDVFTVSGTTSCKCGANKITLAEDDFDGLVVFRCCGHVSETAWRDARRFRPLLDASLEEQVNELEEQPVEV